MLRIPTLRELRIAAQQDLKVEADGALREALTNALAFALAAIGYMYMLRLAFLSRQLFVDTANDAFALLWASIFGITPTDPTQAVGPVKVTGTPGSSLAGGETLQRGDGVEFTVDGPVTLPATGEEDVAVTAVEAGSEGNTESGETLTFTAPPAGIDAAAIVNGALGEDGIAGGFDTETPASVKSRTLALIRAPRRGGSEEDYEIWATSRPGIAQAFARGSYAGIGTVLVIIAKEYDPTAPGDSPIPTASQIADVEAYLETQKPAGLHLVAVQPPVLQPLDPYIVLTPDTADIRTAVTERLALALAAVRPGEIAYYDDLVDAINRAPGEEHHRLFVDDGFGVFGPYDTQVGDNNLMTPGTITWTEPP